ncbi:glutaminase [Anopheles sinensis]|uniref:Glutaminase n=1 Tax=Anopheles sinensis TaxID=74873 RepID=A0A084W9R6_ANOSI|nr:glutaminase [Anopheles sinensis]
MECQGVPKGQQGVVLESMVHYGFVSRLFPAHTGSDEHRNPEPRFKISRWHVKLQQQVQYRSCSRHAIANTGKDKLATESCAFTCAVNACVLSCESTTCFTRRSIPARRGKVEEHTIAQNSGTGTRFHSSNRCVGVDDDGGEMVVSMRPGSNGPQLDAERSTACAARASGFSFVTAVPSGGGFHGTSGPVVIREICAASAVRSNEVLDVSTSVLAVGCCGLGIQCVRELAVLLVLFR